jgi:hypothetical protein
MREFSDTVLAKAKALSDEKVMPDDDYPDIWWVEASSGDQFYRVQSDYDPGTRTLSWVTCTCPHGLNAGAGETTCYHAAAVLMRLRDNPIDQEGDRESIDAVLGETA